MIDTTSLVKLFAEVAEVCKKPGVKVDENGNNCLTGLPVVDASSVQLQQILQIVLGIFGAIAVLIIVIAGLKFVTSAGNPQSASKARSTILYAIIGLIVISAAEVIVSFVLGKV